MKKHVRPVSLALAFVVLVSMLGISVTPVAAATAENDYSHYFYVQLKPEQKVIYDTMEAMLDDGTLDAGGSKLVDATSISSQIEGYAKGDSALVYTYAAARDAFAADHPEVFWVNFDKLSFIVTQDSTAYKLSLGAGREETYYNKGFSSQEDVKAAQAELNSKINGILDGTSGMSTQEIVTKVHNAIIMNCTYRLEIDCTEGNEDLVRTAYGALVKGEALCEGYSEAMKLVLDAKGIPCVYVTGYVEIDGKPQLHAWNEVQVGGRWYAVDATYDDPLGPDSNQDNGGKDGYENTTYLLVGAETMNRTHQPDGIMSEANYEFEYPIMSDSGIKFEQIVNNSGLVVEYSADEMVDGYNTGTFQVSFNGMGYAKAAENGYWILSRSYLYGYGDDLVEVDWSYLTPDLYTSGGLVDSDAFVSWSAAQIAYVEFAVTTTPIGGTSDFSNLYFKGDPTTIIAESGLLHNEKASYVAPPYPCKTVPSTTITLNTEREYDIAITYDDKLVRKDDEDLGVTVVRKDGYGNEMNGTTNYETGAVSFNESSNTLSFHFKPSTMYADDDIIYSFSFTGVKGKESGKDPKPVNYGARFYSAIRSSSCARIYGWNVFAKPALLDIPEDISKWTLEDGTKIPAALTDRMALVVSDATPSQTHAMEDAVANNTATSGDKILASESYNIDFTLCRQQVVTHGAEVSVKIGFPGNYDANSNVTYKVYHFVYDNDGKVERVEEIPCVVTQYGLIAYCSSFSPYMVAAVENSSTSETGESAAPSKSITLNSTYGGSITTANGNAYATLNEGDTVTLNVAASAGYQIASVSALGSSVTVTDTSDMEITVNYEDIGSNNIVEATFVSKAVAGKLADENVTLVEQPTEVQEPASAPDNPDDETGSSGGESSGDEQTTPDTPDEPTNPGSTEEDPKDPADPETPSDPETPGTDSPVTPDPGTGTTPAQPVTPSTPSIPSTPSTPSKPSTPTPPGGDDPEPPDEPDPQEPLPQKPPVAETYSDIQGGAWYESAVQCMVDAGLMTGVSDTAWAPEKTLTRAEAACILFRLDDGTASDKNSAVFADVADDAWYTSYVSYCAEKGYMNGRGNNAFAPERAITREEFVTILYRMAGSPESRQTLSFKDADKVSEWAADAMRWAVENGILIGDHNGNLNPQNSILRCEAAAVLQRDINS